MLVRRRREPPHQRARPRAWVGAAAQRDAKRHAASCALRRRGRACGCERRLRSGRGEGKTCSRAAQAIDAAREVERVGWWKRGAAMIDLRPRLGLAAPAATRDSQRFVRRHDRRARGSAPATKARASVGHSRVLGGPTCAARASTGSGGWRCSLGQSHLQGRGDQGAFRCEAMAHPTTFRRQTSKTTAR